MFEKQIKDQRDFAISQEDVPATIELSKVEYQGLINEKKFRDLHKRFLEELNQRDVAIKELKARIVRLNKRMDEMEGLNV